MAISRAPSGVGTFLRACHFNAPEALNDRSTTRPTRPSLNFLAREVPAAYTLCVLGSTPRALGNDLPSPTTSASLKTASPAEVQHEVYQVISDWPAFRFDPRLHTCPVDASTAIATGAAGRSVTTSRTTRPSPETNITT